MIQDQINLCGSIQSLRLRCYACKTIGHLINNCSMIHFNPDKEKVLKTFSFSPIQERTTHFLRTRKKANFKKFQPQKFKKKISSMNLTNILDDSASDEEENSFEETSNKQYQLSKSYSSKISLKSYKSNESEFFKQNSNLEQNNPLSCFETKNKSNFVLLDLNEKQSSRNSLFFNQNSNLEKKNPSILIKNKSNMVLSDRHEKVNERKPSLIQEEFSSEKPRISLIPIRRPSNRVSFEIDENSSIRRPSFPEETSSMKPKISLTPEFTHTFKSNSKTQNAQIILFDDNTHSPPNSCVNALKSKNDDTSLLTSKTNEDSYIILRDSIEDFDKVQNYKFYFPEFNFNEIKSIYNEKNPWLKMHKRKKIELQRLNHYTFRAIFMYEKLKKKNIAFKKRMRLITKNLKFKEKTFVKRRDLTLEESINLKESFKPYGEQLTISPYRKKKIILDDGKKKIMFTDLVMLIVKKQKEKKKKDKCLSFGWMVNGIKMLVKKLCKIL